MANNVQIEIDGAVIKAFREIVERAGAELAAERARMLARNVELASLLDLLRDDSPCVFDHHGNCQAHNWFGDPPCIQQRISAALADPPEPPAV